MKTKNGFNLRNVCGEHIVVAEGKENIDFSNIISMNETAAFLWQHIQGTTFDVPHMVQLLTQEYDVDATTAEADCTTLLNQWIKAGIVEE